MAVKCADCVHFSAHDVFQGYCEVKKDKVLYDGVQDACDGYVAAHKCKNCKFYQATGELEGSCMGKIFTYPDLPGCEDYTAVEELVTV